MKNSETSDDSLPSVLIYTSWNETYAVEMQLQGLCRRLKVFSRADTLLRFMEGIGATYEIILLMPRADRNTRALSTRLAEMQDDGVCITFTIEERSIFYGFFDGDTHEQVCGEEAFFAPVLENIFSRLYLSYDWRLLLEVAKRTHSDSAKLLRAPLN
ncbi:MAG: hypothetical protein Q7R64_04605 [bacterium]|nr:hypothetical protein [bacterium]